MVGMRDENLDDPISFTVCVRILICANEAPLPPTNGFRLHVFELLKALRADHQVRLLAFVTPDQEQPSTADRHMRLVPRPASTLLTRLLALLRSVLRGHPLGLTTSPPVCVTLSARSSRPSGRTSSM